MVDIDDDIEDDIEDVFDFMDKREGISAEFISDQEEGSFINKREKRIPTIDDELFDPIDLINIKQRHNREI